MVGRLILVNYRRVTRTLFLFYFWSRNLHRSSEVERAFESKPKRNE